MISIDSVNPSRHPLPLPPLPQIIGVPHCIANYSKCVLLNVFVLYSKNLLELGYYCSFILPTHASSVGIFCLYKALRMIKISEIFQANSWNLKINTILFLALRAFDRVSLISFKLIYIWNLLWCTRFYPRFTQFN